MYRDRCTDHIFLIDAFQASCFISQVYAYGMCCALGVGTIWLIITSKMGLNVSSTHSISEFPFLSDFYLYRAPLAFSICVTENISWV